MFAPNDLPPVSDDEFDSALDDSLSHRPAESKLVLNTPDEDVDEKVNGTDKKDEEPEQQEVPINDEFDKHRPPQPPAQPPTAPINNEPTFNPDDGPSTDIFHDGSVLVHIRAYEKRGEGINAFLVYKIETRVTNIPGYQKSIYEVWRRFSDFLGLREKLVEKYQHKGVVVPMAPEKSLSALTKTKLNTTNDDNYTNDVAEKRARLLERFLKRLVRSPRLVIDCDLIDFLTLDANLPKATSTAALSSNSMKKIFKSFGEMLNKIAFPMDENDRWFEQVHGHVEELDDMLVRLHHAVDGLVAYRRDTAYSSEQLSKALQMIASCEENTSLARTLSKLAESHESLSVVEKHEADVDSQLLAETLQEHLHLTQVLKELFFERVKAWQNWQTQQQLLMKRREAKARLDLAGKADRAQQAKTEVKDQEDRVDQMEKDFLQMSKTIRQEYAHVCKERRKDMKAALIEYLESLAESEQHILEHWQKFAPEVKTII